MDFYIRPTLADDAEDVWELRRMPGVFENILGMPSETLQKSIDQLENIESTRHQMSAVIKLPDGLEKCIGTAGLSEESSPRLRHAASVGIMVNKDYQGMGVGTALMESLLDIADNWLKLVRIELTVFTDNDRAIRMYERLGFEKEGVMRKAAIRNGEYADEYIMSRIRNA